MSQVTGDYPDYTKHNNKSYFFLDCDKPMAPGYWLPPIKWVGRVNGTEVEFEQISESGYAEYDYNFSSFPDELKPAIPAIVKAIDDAMRVMD